MTLQPDIDRDLALRWQNGDAEAYRQLVERHLDPIHRFIHSRCSNPHDAADVSQEVFLEVYLKISNYNSEYPFGTWLYTIARRKLIDRFRRHKPTLEFIPSEHSDTDGEHPARILEARESAREAWETVFQLLPETQATALWLRVQEKHPIEHIASLMSQSVANIKVLLFRARQRLAKEWQPAAPSPP